MIWNSDDCSNETYQKIKHKGATRGGRQEILWPEELRAEWKTNIEEQIRFLCLMENQLFLGYLMPKPFS